MGVGEWFGEFCGNLRIQSVATISSRYKSLTQRLNTDFWSTTSDVAHSLYVGSYGRNTAIEGFSDLDMVFQLPNSVYHQYNQHQGNGQSALLQAVRTSIKSTYATTNIGADGQVVEVPFTDKITFQVVPVFLNDAGSFTFPNSNDGGSWATTNPKPEIEAMKNRNGACNGNLYELCRMMRAWKGLWDVRIGGLLIDALAYQFIENYTYREKSYLYYDYMCRDFFKWMADQSADQDFWRAPGSGQYVYGKGLFQYKAKRCYNISLEALEHAAAGREWSAKQKWREIFGTSFPN